VPELPEVAAAADRLRGALLGRRITRVRVHHAAQRRLLSDADAASLEGGVVSGVTRRGKHQLVELEDGSLIHVHFRMTGDWDIGHVDDPLPPYARVHLDLDDGGRVSLVDPRALSTVRRYAAGIDPLPTLGTEATDPAFDAPALRAALASRRVPIKVALLDQRVVAGVGNIYASEALWLARIDPRVASNRVGPLRANRLASAIRQTMARAIALARRRTAGAGYRDSERFRVYDREGRACRRCGTTIRRIAQGGRGTFFCPGCQKR
jgi:formamidopyrimidine-DNA glycosylase